MSKKIGFALEVLAFTAAVLLATIKFGHAASTDTIAVARQKIVELHITHYVPVALESKHRKGERMDMDRHYFCSGAFVDAQGDILTARHCTEGADKIVAVDSNGFEYQAVIVATSPIHDLALIRIDKLNSPFFKLANSVNVGETVYVMGSPLALTGTLAQGIIAKLAGDETYVDCSVLPGNSGGPAFNDAGELVGITTAGLIVLYGTTHLNIMQSIEAIYGFGRSLH